jgi:hypothetical protein
LIDQPSAFRQPFWHLQQHSFGLCLGALFEFGLDLFNPGDCFWFLDLEGGVLARALRKITFSRLERFPI